jgi:hypothetical protein
MLPWVVMLLPLLTPQLLRLLPTVLLLLPWQAIQ